MPNEKHAHLKYRRKQDNKQAKFLAARQKEAEESANFFLAHASLEHFSGNRKLPLWLTLILLFSIVNNTVEGEEIKNSQKFNDRSTSEGCPLAQRQSFFNSFSNKDDIQGKNITIDSSVYQRFPNCSETQIKRYVNDVTGEAIKTSPFPKETKALKAKVKFSANPSRIFPSISKGKADSLKEEIRLIISETKMLSPFNEHDNMVGSLRHELHHLNMADKNRRVLHCMDRELFVRDTFWISEPFLPADSVPLLKKWANTLQLGLQRLLEGRITEENIRHYSPRIWRSSVFWDNKTKNLIEEGIRKEGYVNIGWSIPDNLKFKEILGPLLPSNKDSNINVINFNRQNNEIWYSVVHDPSTTVPGQLLYALAWDIRMRILQYARDSKLANTIGEIDAFIAGLHNQIIETVFPEWQEFHRNFFDEAEKCNKPPVEIENGQMVYNPSLAPRPRRMEL
jgi:hypothetical protein